MQGFQPELTQFRDRDYVVKDDEVLIVDEFTGRIMPGRRFSDGLHQAIEAKENVKVKRESKTLATITFQNFYFVDQFSRHSILIQDSACALCREDLITKSRKTSADFYCIHLICILNCKNHLLCLWKIYTCAKERFVKGFVVVLGDTKTFTC